MQIPIGGEEIGITVNRICCRTAWPLENSKGINILQCKC